MLSQVTSRLFNVPPGRLGSGTPLRGAGARPRVRPPSGFHREELLGTEHVSVLIARLKAEAEAERRAALEGVA